MIAIDIPGYKKLQFKHLVLDYNGTLACDGKIISGVEKNLKTLADKLNIYVLTADTFGKARSYLELIPCKLSILSKGRQDVGKLEFVKNLGLEHVVSIGNGRNDKLMLQEASLGIAVALQEGLAVETLLAADIVCSSIISALELLDNPLRLTATLRS